MTSVTLPLGAGHSATNSWTANRVTAGSRTISLAYAASAGTATFKSRTIYVAVLCGY